MRKRSVGVVFGIAMLVAVASSGATLSARVPEHGYVTSSLLIPTNSAQAKAYGRDIDGDGHPDNALGSFFVAMASQNLDFQLEMDAAIQGGHLLMLHSLRTPSFKKTKKATWQVIYAKPTAGKPNLSGGGSFTASRNAPRSGLLRAQISKNHVRTAAGTIPLGIDVGGMLTLPLRKAEIFATCTKTRCTNGRITGVITKNDVDANLIPQLAALFSATVAHDCPGPDPTSCASGSTGQTLQTLFEANNDLVISADELSKNGLIQAVLAPDLDLNHDGKRDALSVGFGFGAVRAKIKH